MNEWSNVIMVYIDDVNYMTNIFNLPTFSSPCTMNKGPFIKYERMDRGREGSDQSVQFCMERGGEGGGPMLVCMLFRTHIAIFEIMISQRFGYIFCYVLTNIRDIYFVQKSNDSLQKDTCAGWNTDYSLRTTCRVRYRRRRGC